MCSVILTYMLVFLDGHSETIVKYLTIPQAKAMLQFLYSEDARLIMEQEKVKEVTNVGAQVVPKFDCKEGPGK